MYLQTFLAVGFILEAACPDSLEGDPCITPNGENASCVSFQECPVIAEAVATFTPEAIQFGQDSTCGTVPGMVCCGSTGFPTTINSREEEEVILSSLSDKTICGLDALPAYRVKGGSVADFKEFPWLAAIEYNSTYTNDTAGIRCGGSLIHKKFILTAAHCIVHVEFVVIRAWLGVTNIGPTGNCLSQAEKLDCVNSIEKLTVVNAISHPHYNVSYGINDIGLLQLENRVLFTEYIRPICLPAIGLSRPRDGTYFSVAGWGITENNTQSDVKLKLEVPMRNDSICNKYLELGKIVITSEQLCVGGEKGKDTCEGDSGGPLMKSFANINGKSQWYQEGLVSYGVGCGSEGRPAIYTRISPYAEWIFDNILDLGGPIFDLKNGDTCETPLGETAGCGPLNECPEVFNLTTRKNNTLRHLARKYFCSDDNELLVCCKSPGPVTEPNLNTEALPNKTVCGVTKTRGGSGSDVVQPGELPWVVGVEFKQNDKDIGIQCSGSVISNRYVLTTGSCLYINGEPVSVWLGNWNITRDDDCNKTSAKCAVAVRKYPIKQAIPHPFYTTFYYDVGLLLLEDDIQFTDYIRPICLTFSNIPSPTTGVTILMPKWERTQNGTPQDVLRKFSLTSNEKCKTGRAFTVHGSTSYLNQLCWEYKDEDFTGNITTVPVIRPHQDEPNGTVQWFLDGVATIYFNSQPTVYYTSITSNLDWIINIISEE